MKQIIIVLVLFISTTQKPEIEIIKKDAHKRLNFYAVNHTDTDQELFFMIRSEGFRRRADRPLIKNIPAKDTLFLMHLIPIKHADTSYQITMSYKPQLKSFSFKKSDTTDIEMRRMRADSLR